MQQTAYFATSFLVFDKNKECYFMRHVCQKTILMKYHALFVNFEKAVKFDIAVRCKLHAALYRLTIWDMQSITRV